MSDGTETGKPMSETTTAGTENAPEAGEQKKETALTQADVDRIVKERIARVEAKYADYDDLKSKAEGAKTVEQKLADLEAKHADAEARALRSDIAAKHGISAEDRDLFLTGSDADALNAQAKRLADRDADRKKSGNVAPKEGDPKNHGKTDAGLREFTSQLFGNAD